MSRRVALGPPGSPVVSNASLARPRHLPLAAIFAVMILLSSTPNMLKAPDSGAFLGGAEGTRTPDPHTASAPFYYLTEFEDV